MLDIRRCKTCLLPASYPDIRFDGNGICNFCTEKSEDKNKSVKNRKRELDGIIKAHKGKNSRYDVMVGLSGGKDSSYVAYYLKKEYDVKILGFNIDIGYRSPDAIQNIELISDKLGIDLLTIRPKKQFLKKMFVHFLNKKGEFCSVCNNLGYLIGASLAWNQKRILGFSPLVVGGWSKTYEFQPGISVTSMQYFFENLTPELLGELKAHPFIEEKVVSTYMRINDPRQTMLGTRMHKELGGSAMSSIQLPDYIEWKVRDIPRILSEEIGWKCPPDVRDSHFDCKLFPIKEYLKFKKYGLTQETIKNSRLVREGLMTREEGLQRIELEQSTEPAVLSDFLNELGLIRDDINWEGEWST
ncbi:MAG: hypothetical protein JRI28_01215 [Deltaproteobacteria bacterium]|nr:hypothetical protein [Deltaproteobacteria bacterium]